MIGPGRPLPDAVAGSAELVDAADDAFVAGIRAALVVGGTLSLLVLAVGFAVFPKAVAEDHSEVSEADRLEVSEVEPAG